MVVYIDGLNEIWNYTLNNQSGMPPEYAKAAHYRYKISRQELTPQLFELTAKLVAWKAELRSITEFSLRPILRNLIIVHYAWNSRVSFLMCKIAETSLAIEEEYKVDGEHFLDLADEALLEFSAQQWHDYHVLIHRVASYHRCNTSPKSTMSTRTWSWPLSRGVPNSPRTSS